MLQKRLASPAKLPRIPQTSHRQSMDEFWKQNIINDWNDEYSPKKAIRAQKATEERDIGLDEPAMSPKKNLPKTDKAHQQSKKAFLQRRNQIAESFLAELDGKVTNGQVSNLAESTGGVKIQWSKTLNTTAGRANWKLNTVKSTEEGKITKLDHHYAVIELAEKVIDDEHRLLNVVAHEFCHLANFMVSGIKNNPHGKEFKAWAAKCTAEFGHRGIEVTTKHSYEIDFKYHWKCGGCGHLYKRHSKSIDPAKVRCGNCKGVLAQMKPAVKENAGNVNGYQAFMKENMRRIKEENPGSPHKEIMSLVARRYQESKTSKMKVVIQGHDLPQEPSTRTNPNSGDPTPDESEIDAVVRKLDFIDLTSSP
jgi:predicted SprT family Zn-dependent metalloprotease